MTYGLNKSVQSELLDKINLFKIMKNSVVRSSGQEINPNQEIVFPVHADHN